MQMINWWRTIFECSSIYQHLIKSKLVQKIAARQNNKHYPVVEWKIFKCHENFAYDYWCWNITMNGEEERKDSCHSECARAPLLYNLCGWMEVVFSLSCKIKSQWNLHRHDKILSARVATRSKAPYAWHGRWRKGGNKIVSSANLMPLSLNNVNVSRMFASVGWNAFIYSIKDFVAAHCWIEFLITSNCSLLFSFFSLVFCFFPSEQAYELSTLTGTQVMLLVASETGHVYTFATRKLQPMITSEAGKQLIQTCLNSPDPPSGALTGDQRMSATGFEETELSYNIGDDDSKVRQLIYSHGHHHGHAHLGHPQPTHYGIDQSLMQPNYATGGQASPLSHTQSYVPPHAGHTHHVPHPHPHSAFKNWTNEWTSTQSTQARSVSDALRSFHHKSFFLFASFAIDFDSLSVCVCMWMHFHSLCTKTHP